MSEKKPRVMFLRESDIQGFFIPQEGATKTAWNIHATTKPEPPFSEHSYAQFREVLPDEIADTDRLNWLIENEAMVSQDNQGFRFWCEIRTGSKCRSYDEKTPREAIDAAMKAVK